MRFLPTPLPGVSIVELDKLSDERGWLARTFDSEEFRAHGCDMNVVQCSTSFNTRAGTLRGMHYQADPHGESKLVRCTRGAIFDVAVDLRADSPTYLDWHGTELSALNQRSLYIPIGCAHGYQTLLEDTEVLYQIGHPHVPEAARGVRWDDPAFGIRWPSLDGRRTISARDRAHHDFKDADSSRNPSGP